ncbi:MAG: rplM [Rhodospirillaceae bacterium]|nr:MAG: rplM [Rhodospirillaceae bacterium]
MKTYSAKPAEIERKWFVVDAKDVVLGRLAAEVAKILRGKHKPIYTPHIDTGDHVVIVNAAQVQLTGNKRKNKHFYWHTGYPGGIKSRTMEQILSGPHPERVICKAVERMITRSPLGRDQMRKMPALNIRMARSSPRSLILVPAIRRTEGVFDRGRGNQVVRGPESSGCRDGAAAP